MLFGVLARSERVRSAVRQAVVSGRWMFGIHVQGDCSWLSQWPLADWQSFVMWPDPDAAFLRGVPVDRILDLNCASFLPESQCVVPKRERRWDLCIVSRASTIKRIAETLRMVRLVLDRYSGLRVNFIVPDRRVLRRGERTYKSDEVVRAYFEEPRRLFSATELRQLSFISASTEAFGNFPIAHDIIANIIAQSKFLFLWSHAEGTPRVIGEALLAGTPCIVSAKLRSGLAQALASQPTVVLDDTSPADDAARIVSAVSNYYEFEVDVPRAQALFADAVNRPRLVAALSALLIRNGHRVDGEWFLDDLPLRLCGHGRKRDLQFMYNAELFSRWFDRLEATDPYDEDCVCGSDGLVDRRAFEDLHRFAERAQAAVRRTRFVVGTTRRRLFTFMRS
ncbi:MAG TPA: hypothetical protein VG871_17470 [Vicinamibacterales bacterium]|nr:hypothetical protein [Vicinamibacterales bacterium]